MGAHKKGALVGSGGEKYCMHWDVGTYCKTIVVMERMYVMTPFLLNQDLKQMSEEEADLYYQKKLTFCLKFPVRGVISTAKSPNL